MIKEVLEAALMIIPPADGAPAHVYRYRVVNALLVFGMALVLSLFIGLAYALIPIPSLAFARASEMTDLKAQVQSIEVLMLDAQIYTLREKQCKAEAGQREAITQRLYSLLEKYRQVTGQQYRLPGCDEF